MPDPRQLPYLLNLLDDESEAVQGTVLEELKAFGTSLTQELNRLSQQPSARQKEILDQVLEGQAREKLKKSWSSWFYITDETIKLETAFRILAEFQSRSGLLPDLKSLLDQLAADYRQRSLPSDPLALAEFLFGKDGLQGAHADYYNPQNSNLLYVIDRKQGIPISLTGIFVLIAARLGLVVGGCNMPGHFLAKAHAGGKTILIDCFNKGRIVEKEEIALINPNYAGSLKDLMEEDVTTEMIMRRVLNNLITAYRKNEEWGRSQLMTELLEQLEQFSGRSVKLSAWDLKRLSRGPAFRTGEIIKHSRYGYRGMVVDFDLSCQAEDDWYFSNQMQPKKNQPWYYILVNKSSRVTYVAENFLVKDEHKEIRHPLVEDFFIRTASGIFQRNNRPWPRN